MRLDAPDLLIRAPVANAASFVPPIPGPGDLVVHAAHVPPLPRWLAVFGLPSPPAVAATYAALRWSRRATLREEAVAREVAPASSTCCAKRPEAYRQPRPRVGGEPEAALDRARAPLARGASNLTPGLGSHVPPTPSASGRALRAGRFEPGDPDPRRPRRGAIELPGSPRALPPQTRDADPGDRPAKTARSRERRPLALDVQDDSR